MEMELGFWWWVFTAFLGGFIAACVILKRANDWFYTSRLGPNQYTTLPPGDMGWPLVGNMWFFLFAFKFGHPDSFISYFINRFGRTGIYRAYMFGSPTIIVTAPETCRRVLMDDVQFKQGWPKSTFELLGRKSFLGISEEEHKRLRRLTAAPINGQKALSMYHEYIKDVIATSLDELAKEERPIEFLTEIRKITFKIIMYIFVSRESGPMVDVMEKEYAILNHGLRAMAINLPGFAYHKALKARRKLVDILQAVIDRRKAREKSISEEKTDMLDLLLEVEDENGRNLDDEEIIDVILMYLNAGHESSAHATMWAAFFLYKHPEYLQKAKAEQDEILRRRPSTDKGLSFKEIKQMEYLSKVIDETLRVVNVSLFTYREAKTDVGICGYTIPQGWKVLVWYRGIHLDPEIYENPKEFNPSRWEGHIPLRGTFIPFGIGSRLCPGSDLTKLEISVFLHYFLLYYELELLNPGCAVGYLPHSRPKDNCLARINKLPSLST
ncbi:ent-kaurenoic acid oxidase 2 isoform X1 [Ziziphus jujuba]|uniref:Ent-kaurenoic acid oxidase 2 isoform X1 n=1 Tax=Ziziphus jujuba TaxID=326968 RepID=A0A6P4AHI4_ZIZJJ|nr:ent-kaurenoic acid oxidase 2 isoform X1 [Ziziphus jujuba]